jgi:3-deoxy-D-manno-octulosonate 8-phosphate phosphatase (KDO 8-P phosphatase)
MARRAIVTPARSRSSAGHSHITAALARRIRFVGFDVDGVLTDGGIYLGDVGGQRLELKRFDIQDGVGIKLLQKAGIVTAIITGRVSESVALRARELGVDDVIQDPHARKLPALRRILESHGIALKEAAFVGDDLPDLSVLGAVGLPVVVANCSPDARRAAKLRLKRTGGNGAVREFVEVLLRARGEWDGLVRSYVQSRTSEEPS